MTWVVLIPVKNTGIGKSRLGEPGPERARLAAAIALDTVTAALAGPNVSRVIVVTDDDGFARSLPAGVEVSTENATAGIDAALATAAASIGDGVPRAALLGDLPALLPTELSAALAAGEAVRWGAVADANGTGTTLVTANAGIHWQTSFGRAPMPDTSTSAPRRSTLPPRRGFAPTWIRPRISAPSPGALAARRRTSRARARHRSGS